MKTNEEWSTQLWKQFMQLREKSELIHDFNEIWTCDLAIPMRCSNQLSHEATGVGSWSIMCLYVPVKEMNLKYVYEINHRRNENKWRMTLAVVNAIYTIPQEACFIC